MTCDFYFICFFYLKCSLHFLEPCCGNTLLPSAACSAADNVVPPVFSLHHFSKQADGHVTSTGHSQHVAAALFTLIHNTHPKFCRSTKASAVNRNLAGHVVLEQNQSCSVVSSCAKLSPSVFLYLFVEHLSRQSYKALH